MASRRLTRRQAQHVQRIQERRLARAKARSKAAPTAVDPDRLGPEEWGLVVANFGASLAVEDRDQEIVRCVARANLGLIVSGDRVVMQRVSADQGVVSAVEPRRTELGRPDFHGALKPLAANIDRLVAVSAVRPALDTHLIDRYLVAAELIGVAPLLVVNKTDLASAAALKALHEEVAVYRRIGYPVIFASTKHEHGLDALFHALAGHVSILVGQSGVGKSSLIKALLPDQAIRIGALSEATGHGRHTTSATMLYHLPSGGDLIDSPGVRDFGLYEHDPQRLAEGFVEFRPYLGHCRFRDCRHGAEPGCALRRAVQAQAIDERRLQSYLTLVEEMGDPNGS